MPETESHRRKILLVEDNEANYRPVLRWLRQAGYTVRLAKSLEEALAALDSEHFHLAIVDIRLVESDDKNEDGMKFLQILEQKNLIDFLPVIVLTAHETRENLLKATQDYRVAAYLLKESDIGESAQALQDDKAPAYVMKEPGYAPRLMQKVNDLFRDRVQVNFDLEYDAGSESLIEQVSEDITWAEPPKPPPGVLYEEVRDLFGRLFWKANSVYLAKLQPGLTGAALVRAQPTWNLGLGPSRVVKIGRRDKVETERARYEDFVKPYLPHSSTQVEYAITRHLGALLYTFVESESKPFEEFDDFYLREDPETIAASLAGLFFNTCRYWFDRRERKVMDLRQVYYDAFQLEEARLVRGFQDVLPGFQPNAGRITLPSTQQEVLNPLAWLHNHPTDLHLPVNICITHGDLTGRNIMVDGDKKCWLIDFYRTRPSHVLRDFVILETDVKYRLMPRPALPEFLQMEQALLERVDGAGQYERPAQMPDDLHKAAAVIQALRAAAGQFANGIRDTAQSRREYRISLLIATLNVVRLRHIDPERKLQAVQSAALICTALDRERGR